MAEAEQAMADWLLLGSRLPPRPTLIQREKKAGSSLEQAGALPAGQGGGQRWLV